MSLYIPEDFYNAVQGHGFQKLKPEFLEDKSIYAHAILSLNEMTSIHWPLKVFP